MTNFNTASHGYDPEEVNKFLDDVIAQVERMIEDSKKKSAMIKNLSRENNKLKDKIERYQKLESTFNNAILMATKTAEQVKATASRESELIITNAKQNANRIVNEALLRSEKLEQSADTLKRNIIIYKKRLRSVIETQLELVDDIEKIEL